GGRDALAPVVGLLVLAGFASVVVFMLSTVSASSDATWARTLQVFGSVEALAFGAAGFFFGREVHRERAVRAEEHAKVSDKKASHATEIAIEAEKKANQEKRKTVELASAIK